MKVFVSSVVESLSSTGLQLGRRSHCWGTRQNVRGIRCASLDTTTRRTLSITTHVSLFFDV